MIKEVPKDKIYYSKVWIKKLIKWRIYIKAWLEVKVKFMIKKTWMYQITIENTNRNNTKENKWKNMLR